LGHQYLLKMISTKAQKEFQINAKIKALESSLGKIRIKISTISHKEKFLIITNYESIFYELEKYSTMAYCMGNKESYLETFSN
jgi:hypothetical protein